MIVFNGMKCKYYCHKVKCNYAMKCYYNYVLWWNTCLKYLRTNVNISKFRDLMWLWVRVGELVWVSQLVFRLLVLQLADDWLMGINLVTLNKMGKSFFWFTLRTSCIDYKIHHKDYFGNNVDLSEKNSSNIMEAFNRYFGEFCPTAIILKIKYIWLRKIFCDSMYFQMMPENVMELICKNINFMLWKCNLSSKWEKLYKENEIM